MFIAHLEDGTVVSERDCFWHDVPRTVKIKKLQAAADGVCDSIEGFDAYGFQKYQITGIQGPDQGKVISWGCQLIGVDEKAGVVVTVDINPVSGMRETTRTELTDLSYSRELLRSGHGR